jgi:hypothetical protein
MVLHLIQIVVAVELGFILGHFAIYKIMTTHKEKDNG